MRKRWGGVYFKWEGEGQESYFTYINLRSQVDAKIEIRSKQIYLGVWESKERSDKEIRAKDSSVLNGI